MGFKKVGYIIALQGLWHEDRRKVRLFTGIHASWLE